ncbi:GDYXXLXY domain-containing protein, partial [Marinimicrobium sp. UBA4509]
MTLRFEIGNQIRDAVRSNGQADDEPDDTSEGYAIVRLDEQSIAHFVRLAASTTALEEDQRALFYRQRNGRILFATNAFFFQEGQAERYEAARYGRFRVNEEGEPLLVGLHD